MEPKPEGAPRRLVEASCSSTSEANEHTHRMKETPFERALKLDLLIVISVDVVMDVHRLPRLRLLAEALEDGPIN